MFMGGFTLLGNLFTPILFSLISLISLIHVFQQCVLKINIYIFIIGICFRFFMGISNFGYKTNKGVMGFWWWSTLQCLRVHFPWPSPCVETHKPYSLFRSPIMQNRSSVQAWQSRLKRSAYHHRFLWVPRQD